MIFLDDVNKEMTDWEVFFMMSKIIGTNGEC